MGVPLPAQECSSWLLFPFAEWLKAQNCSVTLLSFFFLPFPLPREHFPDPHTKGHITFQKRVRQFPVAAENWKACLGCAVAAGRATRSPGDHSVPRMGLTAGCPSAKVLLGLLTNRAKTQTQLCQRQDAPFPNSQHRGQRWPQW